MHLLPSRYHLLYLTLFSVLLLLPAFILGSGGSDLHCHSLRLRLFSEQFLNGNLYPRWLMGMNDGNGAPVFFYYPPLAFYVGALFHFLTPLDAFGYYPIVASALVATMVSGVTFYAWMREEGLAETAAFIGSLVYLSIPFHLAHSFYFTLLFGAVWGYAWIPLLLLFARRLGMGQQWGIPGFALSLCLLILSNLPMTVFIGPTGCAYALAYLKKSYGWAGARILIACCLGFGLSAFFLLPALASLGATNLAMQWARPEGAYENIFVIGDYSAKLLHFGFTNSNQSFYSLAWLSMLVLTLLFYSAGSGHRRARTALLVVSLASLVLILAQSKLIWELIPILKTLQHPARLFAVSSVAIAALAAMTLPRMRWLIFTLILLFLCITAIVAAQTRMSMAQYRVSDPQGYQRYQLQVDEYAFSLPSPALIKRFFTPEGLKAVESQPQRTEVLEGDAVVEVLQWQPRHMVFHYKAASYSTVRIHQLYYPGFEAWQGTLLLTLGKDPETGQLTLLLPPGEGYVSLILAPLLPETLGKLITLLALGLLFVPALLSVRDSRSKIKSKNQ